MQVTRISLGCGFLWHTQFSHSHLFPLCGLCSTCPPWWGGDSIGDSSCSEWCWWWCLGGVRIPFMSWWFLEWWGWWWGSWWGSWWGETWRSTCSWMSLFWWTIGWLTTALGCVLLGTYEPRVFTFDCTSLNLDAIVLGLKVNSFSSSSFFFLSYSSTNFILLVVCFS